MAKHWPQLENWQFRVCRPYIRPLARTNKQLALTSKTTPALGVKARRYVCDGVTLFVPQFDLEYFLLLALAVGAICIFLFAM